MSDGVQFEISPPDAPEVVTGAVHDEGLDDGGIPTPSSSSIVANVVDEQMIRRLLRAFGQGAHNAAELAVDEVEDEPEFLQFTEAELDALAPPLTAYIAARPKLAAAAARGDAIAVGLALTSWASRNGKAWRRIAETRQETDHGHEHREDHSADPASEGAPPVPGW